MLETAKPDNLLDMTPLLDYARHDFLRSLGFRPSRTRLDHGALWELPLNEGRWALLETRTLIDLCTRTADPQLLRFLASVSP